VLSGGLKPSATPCHDSHIMIRFTLLDCCCVQCRHPGGLSKLPCDRERTIAVAAVPFVACDKLQPTTHLLQIIISIARLGYHWGQLTGRAGCQALRGAVVLQPQISRAGATPNLIGIHAVWKVAPVFRLALHHVCASGNIVVAVEALGTELTHNSPRDVTEGTAL
jgi:hypothetical protein